MGLSLVLITSGLPKPPSRASFALWCHVQTLCEFGSYQLPNSIQSECL